MIMMSFFSRRSSIALACLLAACSQGASTSTSNTSATASANKAASDWVHQGATVCETHLTPAVVGEILKSPDGRSKSLGAQACAFETPGGSSISVTLTLGGVAGLDAHMPYLGDVSPLAGVGDKAVRTAAGIEAAKGKDRLCAIDVMPPFAAKLSGDALAEKLGAICNELFALP